MAKPHACGTATFPGPYHSLGQQPHARILSLIILPLFVAGLLFAGAGHAQVPLQGSIRDVESTPKSGPINPLKATLSRATLSQEETTATVDFEVSLKMRDFAELQARVARNEIISTTEMTAKYHPSATDYQKIDRWLSGQGFEITARDPYHLAIFARGTVRQIQSALHTRFARVAFAGQEYSSAVTAPSVPADLAPLLLGIHGLQPHIRAHKHLTMMPASYSSPGFPPYAPQDVMRNYSNFFYPTNIIGAGQTIAIVIDTFPATSDLTAFWSINHIAQSLNNISFIQVVVGTLPAPSGEETLDTEWASSIAPSAKIRVYATKDLQFSHVDQAYQQIYTDVTTHPEYGIHQLSLSFGVGETYTTASQVQTDHQYFTELASAGVTVFASAGDGGSTPDKVGGATGPSQAEFPASDPNITSVGGTRMALNNFGYLDSETGWSLGGGGTSIYFDRPSWQTGPGVPAGTKRLVPDVASAADPTLGAMVYFNGATRTIGGTSWACPTWAGFGALLNQVRMNANLTSMGNLAPQIYPLLGSDNLRDITTGSNGYAAGPGYDLVTGCGVPNLRTLAQTFGPSPMTMLHSFGGSAPANDGASPTGMILANDGNFYGTTLVGGSAGNGTVFKMTPQGVVTILHHFGDGSVPLDGAHPYGITQAPDGNFYGVTNGGGTIDSLGNYRGTIFKMTPQGAVTILHDFGNSSVSKDGDRPLAPMTLGADGNLYGTTSYGGTSGSGSAFKISLQGSYTLLHSFNTNDGIQPTGLVQAPDGNFYGMTSVFGPNINAEGTIFKMTPDGVLTVIHTFQDGTVTNDGYGAQTSLTVGPDGNLYGSTVAGGSNSHGMYFKITPQGIMTVLHYCADGSVLNDGENPYSPLLLGIDGNFYGSTSSGGGGDNGTVFKMTPEGVVTILHNVCEGTVTDIDYSGNESPFKPGNLIQTADGTLYGTGGAGGGSAHNGGVFKLVQVNALNFTSAPSVTFTAGYAGSFALKTTGTPAPTFSATGLPAWATLDPVTGILSGTPPDASGSPYAIVLTLTNGSLPTATQAFTLNVQPPTPPAFTSIPLAVTYTWGLGYNFACQATGYPAPSFALNSGSLPPGMALSSSGALSGIPTSGGLYTGTFTASNGISPSAVQSFSIAIQQRTKFTGTPLNATATVGTPYNYTFPLDGYPVPTLSIFGGPPPGLTLSANGVLSGTPAPGSGRVYSGTVYASNNYGGYGSSDSQSFTLTVLEAPSLAAGLQPGLGLTNNTYSFSFATGAKGYPAPTYSITQGAAPSGLTMASTGTLSGFPSRAGTYNFTVTASNGVNPGATQNFSITVYQTAYRTWSNKYFSAAQQADPNVCAFTASPQNDGVSNLLKYTFNINPAQPMTAADRAALPTVGMQNISGQAYLTLTYRKNSTLSGIIVSVQSSANMSNWTTLFNPTTVQLGTDPTTGDPILQVQVLASVATRFLRLMATYP